MMEGENKRNRLFGRIKNRLFAMLGKETAETEYTGMRLPASMQFRVLQTFLVFFAIIFTSMFIFVGYQPAPTDAINYPELSIPAISLETTVAPLELVDRRLEAPATIAGSYSQNNNKTLLIGHSTTVFKDLHNLAVGNTFYYANKKYLITKTETLPKENIDMEAILAPSKRDTIIIMTCAGELLENQDATHRLLVTAVITRTMDE